LWRDEGLHRRVLWVGKIYRADHRDAFPVGNPEVATEQDYRRCLCPAHTPHLFPPHDLRNPPVSLARQVLMLTASSSFSLHLHVRSPSLIQQWSKTPNPRLEASEHKQTMGTKDFLAAQRAVSGCKSPVNCLVTTQKPFLASAPQLRIPPCLWHNRYRRSATRMDRRSSLRKPALGHQPSRIRLSQRMVALVPFPTIGENCPAEAGTLTNV